jgi:hypothetical protein
MHVQVSDGDSSLPMITMCNLYPIRCGCDAFYDESLYTEPYFSRILPYICREAIVLKTEYMGQKSPAGLAIGYDVIENEMDQIDIEATKLSAKSFKEKLHCDHG